jgi:hypothetical protein
MNGLPPIPPFGSQDAVHQDLRDSGAEVSIGLKGVVPCKRPQTRRSLSEKFAVTGDITGCSSSRVTQSGKLTPHVLGSGPEAPPWCFPESRDGQLR